MDQMENEILLIDKTQIQKLRAKLTDTSRIDSCIEEVRRMIDIKSGLCWRADARASCCCGPDISLYLNGELQLLEAIFLNLESGNISKAASSLKEYETIMESTPSFGGIR